MDRIEFTRKISELLICMFDEGESPILDYVKRSAQEQNRLYKEGKSRCDGFEITSAHQYGKAADIYFIREGKLADPLKGWEYWHRKWEEMGGRPMIWWDRGHFEG